MDMNIEFGCLTGTRRGFIVGGNQGCLFFYDIGINFFVLILKRKKFLNCEYYGLLNENGEFR